MNEKQILLKGDHFCPGTGTHKRDTKFSMHLLRITDEILQIKI